MAAWRAHHAEPVRRPPVALCRRSGRGPVARRRIVTLMVGADPRARQGGGKRRVSGIHADGPVGLGGATGVWRGRVSIRDPVMVGQIGGCRGATMLFQVRRRGAQYALVPCDFVNDESGLRWRWLLLDRHIDAGVGQLDRVIHGNQCDLQRGVICKQLIVYLRSPAWSFVSRSNSTATCWRCSTKAAWSTRRHTDGMSGQGATA